MSADAMNFHIQYPGVSNQYWEPESGRFAGGDHLLTALNDGWEIVECVRNEHFYAGMRSVTIFEFNLKNADHRMMMPVIANPAVERLIARLNLEVPLKKDEEAA